MFCVSAARASSIHLNFAISPFHFHGRAAQTPKAVAVSAVTLTRQRVLANAGRPEVGVLQAKGENSQSCVGPSDSRGINSAVSVRGHTSAEQSLQLGLSG